MHPPPPVTKHVTLHSKLNIKICLSGGPNNIASLSWRGGHKRKRSKRCLYHLERWLDNCPELNAISLQCRKLNAVSIARILLSLRLLFGYVIRHWIPIMYPYPYFILFSCCKFHLKGKSHLSSVDVHFLPF